MASIAGLGKIAAPNFSGNMSEEDARAIRNYCSQLQDQLIYVLRNLDEENFSAGALEKMKGADR